jgi:preprotein translocase subunit SecE
VDFEKRVNWYVKLGLWVCVIGTVFIYAWRKGVLVRMANYAAETREELKKCTWPTVDELKGSTVVVMVTLGLLGVFTVVIDAVVSVLIRWMLE